MSTRTARLTTLTTAVWLACTTGGLLTAAERIELREDAADSRIRKVEIE